MDVLSSSGLSHMAVSRANSPPPPTKSGAIWFNYMHSGSRWHVLGGVVAIGAVAYLPWYLMTSGKKQSSHQDYMESAEKARQSRLSTSR